MCGMAQYDFLIIGQGLAGSLLAWHLLSAGKKVMVVDNGHRNSSSLVAAGLVNPLAGMRLIRPPLIDHWLTAANRIYSVLEQASGRPLHHVIDMVRLFHTDKQFTFLQRALELAGASTWLGDQFPADASGQPVRAPLGGVHQHRTGYVDLPPLLGFISGLLRDRGALTGSELDYRDIRPGEKEIGWKQLTAGELIFCEGYRAQRNPWFNSLPFDPAKGEILTLQGTGNQPDRIINGKHWLVPLAQGGFRFGATYDHDNLDNRPTGAGRMQLLSGLDKLLLDTTGMTVTAHQAGVRPTTQDKQPFLGSHPEFPRLHIFNGFGARGTLTIPWYAERFARSLINGDELPEEADIGRYSRKFSVGN